MRWDEVWQNSNITVRDLSGRYLRTENRFAAQSAERMIARLFEGWLGKPKWHFRPKWLRNPVTGKSLEIDLYYAPKIATWAPLAIEFDGRFHRTDPRQRMWDVIKDYLCWRQGVALVRITMPEWVRWKEIGAGLGYWRRRVNAANKRLAVRRYGRAYKRRLLTFPLPWVERENRARIRDALESLTKGDPTD